MGDSHVTAITPDGNSVLFESTALNLTSPTNGSSFSGVPGVLNVYVRDRTTQQTRLISTGSDGTSAAKMDSFAKAISTNGNLVLFETAASNIAAADTNQVSDIFLRSLAQPTNILISAATNGQCANGESHAATMTPDGRYVAFASSANNLVPGDTNGIADVFVRDTVTATTLLVSTSAVSAGVVYGGVSASDRPAISADGRYIAFYSTATNLVTGLRTTNDIYVRDMILGTTYCATLGARSLLFTKQQSSNAVFYAHVLSADGSTVAFEVTRTGGYTTSSGSPFLGLVMRYTIGSGTIDLVATNSYVASAALDASAGVSISADGRYVAFIATSNSVPATTWAAVWDGQSGTTSVASQNLSNTVSPRATCDEPVIAPHASWVSFVSSSTNLVTNSLSGMYHLYLRYLPAGPTILFDQDTNHTGVSVSSMLTPCVGADGRLAAFDTAFEGLVANDRNYANDLFVADAQNLGGTELISAKAPSLPSSTPNGGNNISKSPFSNDGACCTFSSAADDLVANDTNACSDVFMRDLTASTNVLISANTNGLSGNGASLEGVVDSSGRYVAFTSRASDLDTNDANSALDVFVRDRQTGMTALASKTTTGSSGNGDSYSPQLSADARFVLFRSKASNLTSSAVGATENLYLRDLQLTTNYLLNANSDPLVSARMTSDGKFVVFGTSAFNSSWYVWDTQLAGRTYTNSVAGVTNIGISLSGTRVAWSSSTGVFVKDTAANTTSNLSTGIAPANSGLTFSADNRWLAYTRVVSNVNQIYLFDFVTQTNLLISRSWSNSTPANGQSDSPVISSNGRFIAYRSFASDIVPGDTNHKTDVFMYDRQTDTTLLLSSSLLTSNTANDHSLNPVFSPDSRSLAFETWASDSVSDDFNGRKDVVVVRLFSSNSIPVFAIQINSATPTSRVLTWPTHAGTSYKVQFKDTVSDNWSDLAATITIAGNQAYCTDSAGGFQRFYRVLAF